jgi:pyruvate/2-oxoglutarate dehydrogenase complex dihydrolipoamide dehydrogenase (E3) component
MMSSAYRSNGMCAQHRCTPTKTLVASAYAAHLARRATDYGVRIGGPITVDMKGVKARKDAVVEVSRRAVERSLKTLEGCTVYEGHGRFTAGNTVAVDRAELGGERIFINVGGRASVPPIPGLDQIPYLTNSSMMDLDFLPRHLIILGGSYVGLEFAQVFKRFGSEVSVIELAPLLIAREDEDVSRAVAEFLEREGVSLHLGCRVVGVERVANEIVVKVDTAGTMAQVRGTHLLVAIGRQPNTDDLGLDKAGIATDPRGQRAGNLGDRRL